MPDLKLQSLLLFLAFVLPGFISMKTYALVTPVAKPVTLKDGLLEAIAFSLVNIVLMFWPLYWLMEPRVIELEPLTTYATLIAVLLIAPVAWPLLLLALRSKLSKRGWWLSTSPTAWDHFFRNRRPCWVLVRLANDTLIGGWFGTKSFASSSPDGGHLYLEELWTVNAQGGFDKKVERSLGMILRPGDYKTVEFFTDT